MALKALLALSLITLCSADLAVAKPNFGHRGAVLWYERYQVNRDLTLPVLGRQDPNSRMHAILPGNIDLFLKGPMDNEVVDRITVLDEFEDPNFGQVVRLGLDLGSDSTGKIPSDVYMTTEDFEILVNDSSHWVEQIDIGPEETLAQKDTASIGAYSRRITRRHHVHSSDSSIVSKDGNLCGGRFSEECYRQVKLWLKDNHFLNVYLPGGTALDAAEDLPANGFHPVGVIPMAIRGDVCVYKKGGKSLGHKDGHVEVFDGENWEGSGCRKKPMEDDGRVVLQCFQKDTDPNAVTTASATSSTSKQQALASRNLQDSPKGHSILDKATVVEAKGKQDPVKSEAKANPNADKQVN